MTHPPVHPPDIGVLGGAERTAVEGQPLRLTLDHDRIVYVGSGSIDVFATHLDEGRPVGARHHLLRVSAGQALFGLGDAIPDDLQIVAVAGVDSQLDTYDREPLAGQLAESPEETAQALAHLVDSWVEVLASAVAPTVRPRRLDVVVPTGKPERYQLADVHTRSGVAWARHRKGGVHFLGQVPVDAESWCPVTQRSWLHLDHRSGLEARATRDLVADGAPWTRLDDFNRMAIELVAEDARRWAEGERRRLAEKAAHDKRTLAGALTQAAAVLEAGPDELVSADHGGDPLLAACQAVGAVAGITFREPKGGFAASADPLQRIVRAARCRSRRVILKTGWWRSDNGPLLAFLEEGHQPVALLPRSPGRYDLVEPIAGRRRPIDGALADALEPVAHYFYRPLPRQLTIRELVRFGLFGCTVDLRRALGMGVAIGMLGMIVPIITGILFGDVIPGGQRANLAYLTAALVIAASASALFTITQSLAMLRLTGKMDVSLQAGVWDRLLGLPADFFRRFTAGDLAQRAMGIGVIRRTLTNATLSVVLSGIFSVFSYGLLFYYDPGMALAATGLVVVTVAMTGFAGYLQLGHLRAVYDIQGKLSGTVLQFMSGIGKLRVTGSEQRAFSLWARIFSDQKRRFFRARSAANGLSVFDAAFTVVATLLLYWMVVAREMWLDTGTFLAFMAAFGQVLGAALAMAAGVLTILSLAPVYERLEPILDATPESHEQKPDPGKLSGDIEVRRVTFRYDPDGPPVLHDISLSVEPHEFIAIVGPSGSGKSTLLRVLLGFEHPESGAVLYDGQNLDELDILLVRQQIGVVLQDGRLMPGDIFSNITGSTGLSVNDAWEAARLVGLDREIRAMPMGMHTIISEGGSGISGGQRQRLLIARAIIDHPRVLIFDEATSALDNKAQAAVSESIEALDTTRLVIAHRLSTIRHADRIYVLDKGRIVESGTYQALMAQDGLFAELARRQLA